MPTALGSKCSLQPPDGNRLFAVPEVFFRHDVAAQIVRVSRRIAL